MRHTEGMIRLGTPADLAAADDVFRHASLYNEGDRANLLAHPDYLVLEPQGLAEGRTYVAELDGQLVGFATWAEIAEPDESVAAGTDEAAELEDLFVDPAYMRRGIATALVRHVADVMRARGVRYLEVIASPYALDFYHAAGFADVSPAETDFGPALRMVLAVS